MAINPKPERFINGQNEFRIDRVNSAPPQNIESDMDITAALSNLVLLNVECESEEEEQLTPFKKFLQIERLIEQFPQADAAAIKEGILAILARHERTPVDISFCFAKVENTKIQDKINTLKNKTSSSIEKVREHFNRVTSSNIQEVIQKIKEISVEKVSEMKEIANFVFEKIISEPVFFDNYLTIVGEIHKVWMCEEERGMKAPQTCFYGTLLSLAYRRLDSPRSWFNSEDQDGATDHDRIEESFTARLKERNQDLGALNFIVSLYTSNVIGSKGLLTSLNNLMSSSAPENVVMICYVFKKLSEKFTATGRLEDLENLTKYLKTQQKSSDLRLQVEIDKVLSGCTTKQSEKKPVSSQKGNTFSSMMIQEDVHEKPKSDDEILGEYISEKINSISMMTDEDEIKQFGDGMFKDIDRFDNLKFFERYISETLLSFKEHSKLECILVDRLLPKAVRLVDSLKNIKNCLKLLCLDAPVALRHYCELLCRLRVKNAVGDQEFESLKTEDFEKQCEGLFKEWKKTKSEELSKVLAKEKIEKLE